MTILAETNTGWNTAANFGGTDICLYNDTPLTASAAGTALNTIIYLPATAWSVGASLLKIRWYRQSTGAFAGETIYADTDGTGPITKALGASFAVANGEQFYAMMVSNATMQLNTNGSSFETTNPTGTYASPPATINPGTDPGGTRGQFRVALDGTVGGGADPPVITDVDTDEIITATQTNVVITGTDFDTATVDITQGSTTVAQSIDSQNSTTIQFDVVFDSGSTDLKYGAATLTVTNGDAQDDDQAITIAAPSGKNFVTLTSVNGTADNRLTATPDLETDDQIEWSNVQGGVIGDVTVNADGTFDCDDDVTAFDVRVWDHDDSTWGSIATQETQDVTPTAFVFTDVTDAPVSDVTTSNTITVAGLGTGVTADVSITGGTYSKNGGGYTSSAGTAVNGDTFAVRVTSSDSYETAVNVVLTIGTASDTFTVTTMEEPPPITTGAGRDRDARRRGIIRLIGRG